MSILIVLAKAPVAGRVKTRLCPPLTSQQAADIALAALNDTLAAVGAVEVDHRVLVLDGEPGDWVPEGFSVLPQKTGLLDQRLIDAFADVFNHLAHVAQGTHIAQGNLLDPASPQVATKREACVLIAMDTPQVHPRQLSDALAYLADADSVIGMAEDGGFWLIGLNTPDPEVFRDIPMSVDSTGAAQLERLQSLGHRVVSVDTLRDIDTFADIHEVTEAFPHLSVSQAWTKMQSTLST
jgi:uncharacterized protein